MPARTAAARARGHATRAPLAPRHHRRVSGPARPVRRAAVALPAPARRGSTSAFERIRALPDYRVVDGLLRGRAWIWLLGLLLGGMVAMQVSLLKLHSGISRAVQTSSTLQRENAELETTIARLSSGERIETAATGMGMVVPAAGAVEYLKSRPGDATRAVRTMALPSETAATVMANDGVDPTATPAPAPVATPAPTAAPAPVATPAPTAVAAPVTTPAPTATTIPAE